MDRHDSLHEACLCESETRLAFKRARARAFLKYVSNNNVTISWQLVAGDEAVQRLEEEWEDARIDLELERTRARSAYVDLVASNSDGEG
jgi:hypothetical protein